ncbi:hypothetical protein [Pajaroellobacter abortibovis]|uniref:Uncharacterized protein n=1 Tax=Pajaroellobacter abortibovis TaxID=1882918 RepID=A0A1L6MV29_9BACT|nr:hypothetical protein [Pajaroellobacter abortibovis]APR99305.1 hypothetical protein BCY86_00410 [Pajaroellobacter abortibovis]
MKGRGLQAGSLLLGGLLIGLMMMGTTSYAMVPWVERPLTLRSGTSTCNVGLGTVHKPRQDQEWGLNLQGAIGLTSQFEMGLRTGIRLGQNLRLLKADQFGRLFDSETYGTRQDAISNLELGLRYAMVQNKTVEMGIEWRTILPIEENSYLGGVFALPIFIHLGHWGRVDSGMYVPMVSPAPQLFDTLSFPVRVWFQINREVWFGPLGAFRIDPKAGDFTLLTGLGLGYSLGEAVDLKGQLLFPHIYKPKGAEEFGLAVGVQLRLE